MQDTEEIWKDVVGYEGLYKVSNYGHVLNIRNPRYIRGKRLTDRNGYRATVISKREPKSSKHVAVHRLVAMAFIPNPENKPFVNHINHRRSDNRVENLEWCTTKENLMHASRHGRLKRNKKETLNSDQIQKILHLNLNHGFSMNRIGKLLNVSTSRISSIMKINKWSLHQRKEYLMEAIRNSVD